MINEYKKQIGKHTFEIAVSSTGSFSPWEGEIMHRFGISAMCTSDVRSFLRVDGDKVYRFRGGVVPVFDTIEAWAEMYEEFDEFDDEELMKEFEKLVNENHGLEKFGSVEEWIKAWGIEGTKTMDRLLAEGKVSNEVFENAAKLYGHLFNYNCFVPGENDIYASEYGSIVFDISIPYISDDATLSIEIGKDGFGFYTSFNGISRDYAFSNIDFSRNSIEDTLFYFLRKSEEKRKDSKKRFDSRGKKFETEEPSTI